PTVLSSCESQLFLEPFPSHTSMMSLQWAAVATFLYAEVLLVFLLCIPFISATRSAAAAVRKVRNEEDLREYLVENAIREIRKYDDVTEKVNLQNNPGAVEHFHMKLFRAQRNLYIAGFSLLMAFLLRRLITLISQHATILASNEAFKKQAEGASDAAKKYMEENDKLKKEQSRMQHCTNRFKNEEKGTKNDKYHGSPDPAMTLVQYDSVHRSNTASDDHCDRKLTIAPFPESKN
ncbi:hypothetical protein Chor_007142, partial [Crotalus horridus]